MRVLVLAVVVDLVVGEPPNRLHPVAWLGALIAAGRKLAPRGGVRLLLLHGAVLLLAVAGAAGLGAFLLERLLAELPAPLALLGQAWLLKCAFSLRGLDRAVEIVRGHLVAGDLEGARRALARDLVSRPTGGLSAALVASAAVESLAENLTDSWVAPLACFLVAGLPGAWLYRAVNTADAMIGYREGALEYLGRAAARADDVLNYLPARAAALGLVAGAGLSRQSPWAAWRIWRRDGGRTASPNAGQTMAAMAGALGVALEKPGHYRLGDGPLPDLAAVDRALAIYRWAAALTLGAALGTLAL